MTYCVGAVVREGLVLMADTRTNAGIDNISTYRKLRIFGEEGKRTVAIAAAGSLSTTQALMQRLQQGVTMPGRESPEFVEAAPTMFRVAQIVGQALATATSEIERTIELGDNAGDVRVGVTLLVGGSIAGGAPQLFLIYGEGNFIECGIDTPYFQVGELKYGKPILDRLLTYDTSLNDAVKIALLSMSSTMRSNLSVGLPLDIMILRPGRSSALMRRIEVDDPYFHMLGSKWSEALMAALGEVPPQPYGLPEH